MQPAAAAASTAATATTAATACLPWEHVTDHKALINMILEKQSELDELGIEYSTLSLQSNRVILALSSQDPEVGVQDMRSLLGFMNRKIENHTALSLRIATMAATFSNSQSACECRGGHGDYPGIPGDNQPLNRRDGHNSGKRKRSEQSSNSIDTVTHIGYAASPPPPTQVDAFKVVVALEECTPVKRVHHQKGVQRTVRGQTAKKYEDFREFAFRYMRNRLISPAGDDPGGTLQCIPNFTPTVTVTADELVQKYSEQTGQPFTKSVFLNSYLSMQDLMTAVQSNDISLCRIGGRRYYTSIEEYLHALEEDTTSPDRTDRLSFVRNAAAWCVEQIKQIQDRDANIRACSVNTLKARWDTMCQSSKESEHQSEDSEHIQRQLAQNRKFSFPSLFKNSIFSLSKLIEYGNLRCSTVKSTGRNPRPAAGREVGWGDPGGGKPSEDSERGEGEQGGEPSDHAGHDNFEAMAGGGASAAGGDGRAAQNAAAAASAADAAAAAAAHTPPVSQSSTAVAASAAASAGHSNAAAPAATRTDSAARGVGAAATPLGPLAGTWVESNTFAFVDTPSGFHDPIHLDKKYVDWRLFFPFTIRSETCSDRSVPRLLLRPVEELARQVKFKLNNRLDTTFHPLGAELFVRFKLDDCDQGKSEITLEGYVRLISEAPAHVVRAWLRLMVAQGTCEPVLGDAATRDYDFHQWQTSVGYMFITVQHSHLPLLSMPPNEAAAPRPPPGRPPGKPGEVCLEAERSQTPETAASKDHSESGTGTDEAEDIVLSQHSAASRKSSDGGEDMSVRPAVREEGGRGNGWTSDKEGGSGAPAAGGTGLRGVNDGTSESVRSDREEEGGGCDVTSSSVFQYMLKTVADVLSGLFQAHGLTRPVEWGDISQQHLDVMASFMVDLHSDLEKAILNSSQLTLKPSIWNLFQRGERLDDSCVDYMLEWLVRAVGSRMYGNPGKGEEVFGEHFPGDTGAGASLRTDKADKWYVFGVLHAETIRGVVTAKKPDATTAPESSFPGVESCWSGESELPDEAVRRIVGGIVGSAASVDKAMLHGLNPFEGRDILVCASFGEHTSVFKLEGRPVGSKGGEFRRWTVSIYDSCSYRKWDNKLRQGMACLLERTCLKAASENFQYEDGVSLIQDDSISCGPMSFINMARILTGESLEQKHSDSCVQVIRNFFDFKHFRDSENKGAIRRGYLEQVLRKALEDRQLTMLLDNHDANKVCAPPCLWLEVV